MGLWVAGVLWFLVGIFKKRNAAAANVVLPGSGTKETPSQRALARLKPEPLAAGDLDLAAVVIGTGGRGESNRDGHGYDDGRGAAGSGTYGGGVRRMLTHRQRQQQH